MENGVMAEIGIAWDSNDEQRYHIAKLRDGEW